MAGFIEEFYYGNIDPQAQSARPDTAVRKEMHHRPVYVELLTNGKLNDYLADLNEQAEDMFSRLVKEFAEKEGII